MPSRTSTVLLALSLAGCGTSPTEVGQAVNDFKAEVATEISLDAQRSRAWDLYRAGEYPAFVAAMKDLSAKSQLDVDLYNLACGQALAGDKEGALATLAIVAERGNDYGLREDEDLASLRGDPRFEALADKVAMHEKASEYLEPYRAMAMGHYEAREYDKFVTIMEKIAQYSANETDLYNLACGYALAGRHDEAIATLSLVADRGAHGQAATDEDFASLRDDPRFVAILARPAAN